MVMDKLLTVVGQVRVGEQAGGRCRELMSGGMVWGYNMVRGGNDAGIRTNISSRQLQVMGCDGAPFRDEPGLQ